MKQILLDRRPYPPGRPLEYTTNSDHRGKAAAHHLIPLWVDHYDTKSPLFNKNDQRKTPNVSITVLFLKCEKEN